MKKKRKTIFFSPCITKFRNKPVFFSFLNSFSPLQIDYSERQGMTTALCTATSRQYIFFFCEKFCPIIIYIMRYQHQKSQHLQQSFKSQGMEVNVKLKPKDNKICILNKRSDYNAMIHNNCRQVVLVLSVFLFMLLQFEE